MNVKVYHSANVTNVATHSGQRVAWIVQPVTQLTRRLPSDDTRINPHHQASVTSCMDSALNLQPIFL